MMLSSLSVLSSALWLGVLLGAQAEDTVTVVDFATDVRYDPPDAWFSEQNAPCQTIDRYTAQINATASLTFTGNRIQISGMRNNKSGIFRVSVDDEQPYEGDLYSDEVDCTLFVDYYLGNGTHNLTIELLGKSQNVSEGGAITPVLHLTDIVYWLPGLPDDTDDGSATATSSSPTSSAVAASSSSNAGVIVGGVLSGLGGLFVVVLGIFIFFKRRAVIKARHTFDPTAANTVYITELSPRSPRSPTSSKFQPYARMEDDNFSVAGSDAKGALGVPTLAYGGRDGLRSRSRSPNPDTKA